MSKTKFRPEADGFKFTNSWTFDDTEKAILRDHVKNTLPVVEAILSPIIIATCAPLFIAEMAVPFIGPWLVYKTVEAANKEIIDQIVEAISADHYGLCGGMTFTAMDYWHKQWVIARGNNINDQPARDTATGSALRDYLWNRLIDSVRDNVETFITWMGVYHFDPLNGSQWLMNHTANELTSLKTTIDGGTPVPIGLVGDTWNPFDNHQVLVYGYNDNMDGTCTLFIYDNNAPDTETTVTLDFSGDSLQSYGELKFKGGTLQGFFCTKYSQSVPPLTLVLESGISVVPPGGEAGHAVNIDFIVKNIGFHDSPPLSLGALGDVTNTAFETMITQILEGQSYEFRGELIFQKSGLHTISTLGLIQNTGNIEIFKKFPPEGNSQIPAVKVPIYDQRTINVDSYGIYWCTTEYVVNSIAVLSTNFNDLPAPVTFTWDAMGGVIQGSKTGATILVRLPADTNTQCLVRVIVHTSDDIILIANTGYFNCISEGEAKVKQDICEKRINKSLAHAIQAQFRPYKNLGDPGPGDRTQINIQQLVSFRYVTMQMVKTLNTMIKENRNITTGANFRKENLPGNLPE